MILKDLTLDEAGIILQFLRKEMRETHDDRGIWYLQQRIKDLEDTIQFLLFNK